MYQNGLSSAPAIVSITSSIEIKYFISKYKVSNAYNIKEAIFVYPNEKKIQGSSLLFTALLEDLYKKDLVAVIKYNGRVGEGRPLHASHSASKRASPVLSLRRALRGAL